MLLWTFPKQKTLDGLLTIGVLLKKEPRSILMQNQDYDSRRSTQLPQYERRHKHGELRCFHVIKMIRGS